MLTLLLQTMSSAATSLASITLASSCAICVTFRIIGKRDQRASEDSSNRIPVGDSLLRTIIQFLFLGFLVQVCRAIGHTAPLGNDPSGNQGAPVCQSSSMRSPYVCLPRGYIGNMAFFSRSTTGFQWTNQDGSWLDSQLASHMSGYLLVFSVHHTA